MTTRKTQLATARLFVTTRPADEVAEHIVNLTEAWQACRERIAEYERETNHLLLSASEQQLNDWLVAAVKEAP